MLERYRRRQATPLFFIQRAGMPVIITSSAINGWYELSLTNHPTHLFCKQRLIRVIQTMSKA